MRISRFLVLIATLCGSIASAADALEGAASFDWLQRLAGEWVLAATQEGEAAKHQVIAPLVGTQQVALSYRLVGAKTTLQENIFPGTPREMATMYHCEDKQCSHIKAGHYCTLKTQPVLRAAARISDNKLILRCDLASSVCESGDPHLHVLTLEMSEDGKRLKETFSVYRAGKPAEDLIFRFERKQ